MSLHESIIRAFEKQTMCGQRTMTEQERLFFRIGMVIAQQAPNHVMENSGEAGLTAFAGEMLDANEEFAMGPMHDFHKMFCVECASEEGKHSVRHG